MLKSIWMKLVIAVAVAIGVAFFNLWQAPSFVRNQIDSLAYIVCLVSISIGWLGMLEFRKLGMVRTAYGFGAILIVVGVVALLDDSDVPLMVGLEISLLAGMYAIWCSLKAKAG